MLLALKYKHVTQVFYMTGAYFFKKGAYFSQEHGEILAMPSVYQGCFLQTNKDGMNYELGFLAHFSHCDKIDVQGQYLWIK